MSEQQEYIGQEDTSGRGRIAALGSLVAALGAASCCVLPLVLISLGVTGAWIGTFSALEPYKPAFAAVAIGFLAAGFWRTYRKPKVECAEGSYCASPTSTRLTRVSLWVATVVVGSALTIDYWAPYFY